ncbi:MAG: nucleotide exchange factor GrpE [Rhodocyclaceae bacterium]|nr:nucleotide exchange factor GrpE [Rhodocyclaceae bacterium]
MQQDNPATDALPEADQQDQMSTDGAPTDASAAPAAEAPQVDTMPSLEEALRLAEQRASEHHDAWLRAKAETENVRRRAQEDVAKAHKFAGEKFAQAMLPVKDSLEAALATENATIESLREGVELTLKQLESAFSGASVSEENPAGQRFDPNLHQAISAIESDAEPNTVIDVLQKGYVMSDRVIRPALVVVSKARGA